MRAEPCRWKLSQLPQSSIEGFLRSKRGARNLHDHVVASLKAYFTAANEHISARVIHCSPPPTPPEVEDWVDE